MSDQGTILLVLIGLMLCALYFAPSLIAFNRKHPNRWLIAVLNIAVGLTVLGWLLLLIWALHAVHRTNIPAETNGGDSGLNFYSNDIRQVSLIRPRFNSVPMEGQQFTILEKVDQISRLKTLLDARAINEIEFEKMKSKILSGL